MENVSFRIRLKELREKKGISQYKLAEELGTSQARIGHWEAGTRECDFSTLQKLAQYFNVSVDYLLGIEGTDITPEEYAAGARMTAMRQVTADEDIVLDKYQEIKELLGKEKAQAYVESLLDSIIENFRK